MPSTIIVVDDFLDDPEPLRQTALTLDYPQQDAAFPGRNSAQRLGIEGLADEVSRLTGEPLRPISPAKSHAKCRVTLASDVGRGRVHIDEAYWSGILYLSRPEDCRGGTEFFRHRRTGTDHAPLSRAEANAHGYASQEEMHHAIVSRDGVDEAAWEMTMRVPMRYNRLLLLRPWLWHTAGEAFGDAIANARLVYLMFFTLAGR